MAAAVLGAAACAPTPSTGEGGRVEHSSSPPAAEARAEDPLAFTATTLAGHEFNAAALAGEPVVLWFWAPWCTICRAEAPDVAKVATDLKGRVTFLGVAGLGEQDEMRGFVEDTGTGVFEHLMDVDGSLWRRFGVVSQPSFAFVDREGAVEVFGGSLDGENLRAVASSLASG